MKRKVRKIMWERENIKEKRKREGRKDKKK